MRKTILILYLCSTGISRSSAQDYTVHGTIDITHSQDDTRKSFETPVGSPDFDFIERELDKSNRQYETGNKTSNTCPEFIALSNAHSVGEWDSLNNNYTQGEMLTSKVIIHSGKGILRIYNTKSDKTRLLTILSVYENHNNTTEEFIQWTCIDQNGIRCLSSFTIDKLHHIVFLDVEYTNRMYLYVISEIE